MEATILNEQAELYARGKLNVSEVASFEEKMKNDPSLAEYVANEKSLAQGVKNFRIASLKARLSAIPVAPIATGGQTISFMTWKAATIILASASLGLGSYFYYTNNTTEQPVVVSNEKEIIETQPEIISQLENKPTVPSEKQIQVRATENVAVETKNNKETATSSSVTSEEATNSEVKSNTSKKISTAKWNLFKKKSSSKKVPNMESFEDDSQANVTSADADAPSAIKSAAIIQKTSDVDIKTIQDGSHNFHYKLKDHVLFLYGKFDASPYEILEFNDKSSLVLYLYYDKNYFAMQQNTEQINKLKKVSDKALIKELETARSR